MSKQATEEQARDWLQRLCKLRDEMDEAFGDPLRGTHEANLVALTRVAADEAAREYERSTVGRVGGHGLGGFPDE